MPRATSHSVWPSATEPPRGAGVALAPSDTALASGAIPGHCPSALIRSSAVIGLSGVSGAVSMETLRMNSLPGRENQSASFESMSLPKLAALEQPAISGAATASSSNRFEKRLCRTICKLPTRPRRLSTTALRHQRGCLDPPRLKPTVIINCRNPLFPALPAAALVRLPIGDLEATRFAVGPCGARRGPRIVLVPVKNHHHPFVGGTIGRERGVVDQEADVGAVRVAVLDRQDDRLMLRVGGPPGGMRQERILAVGPQMRIQCV